MGASITDVTENNRPRHSLDDRYENYDVDFDFFVDAPQGVYTPALEAAKPSDAPTADQGALDAEDTMIIPTVDDSSQETHSSRETASPQETDSSQNNQEAAAAQNNQAGAAASTAAAGGMFTGTNNLGDEAIFAAEPADPDTTGTPKRGLVMILLVLGVLLVGWGGFNLLNNNQTDTTQTASEENTASNSANGAAASDANNAAEENAAPPEDAAAGTEGTDPASPTPSTEGEAAADAASDQNADNAATPPVDPAQEYIAVLNNSQVQGLAGDVAGRIRGGEFTTTGFGNLPAGTFPQSVVLYPENDPAARTAAETIAGQLGISAQPRTPEQDAALAGAQMFEGGAPGRIVVITTGDLAQ